MGGSLSLRGVSKDFNGFKLDRVDLELDPGEYFVLVGPTGSGKTLLLETINGFHQVDSGSILFNGEDITGLPSSKRSIGYVPQTPNLDPSLSLRENLEYTIKLRKLPGDWSREIQGVIEMMRLTDYADRPTLNLSGGEKRKAALARAIILRPQLLLLDEPLSSLDVTSKAGLLDEIGMIHRYLGCTVIHVTHDQQEALGMADKLGVMRRGTIVTTGSVEQVYEDPRDEYVARFLGFQNIYDAELSETGRSVTKMRLNGIVLRAAKAPSDGQTRIGIHGDDIIVSKRTPVATRDNVFKGSVQAIANIGPSVTLTIDMGVRLVIDLSRRRFLEQGINKGDSVWVQFTPESVKQITV
jgi:molybdate/tungstate transport system ATP-binding protein